MKVVMKKKGSVPFFLLNLPGKFLSYMQSGLPVLASINPGNDLAELIQREGVGRVCTDHSVDTLQWLAVELADEIISGK